MKTGQCLLVCCHSCLGFHCQVDGAYRDSLERRMSIQFESLAAVQIDLVMLHQIGKTPGTSSA